MQGLNLAVVIVLLLVWVGVLIWLASDIFDQFGCSGCLVFLVLYFFLAPLFPLIVIGYLLLKAHWQGGPSRTAEKSERVTQFNWRSQRLPAEEDRGHAGAPAGISAAESDEEIDLLLAEGKPSEALERATDLYEMAKSFGDASGMKRYRKYIDYIHSGGH